MGQAQLLQTAANRFLQSGRVLELSSGRALRQAHLVQVDADQRVTKILAVGQ